MNKITGPYSAIFDGKPTSLSGCSNAHKCRFQQSCLRADGKLLVRTAFNPQLHDSNYCTFFISNYEVSK